MMLQRILFIMATLALGACASTSTLEEPAELVDFEQQARFERVWSVGMDDAGEELLLGLKPAYDGQRVFAADHAGNVIAVDARTGKTTWSHETGESGFWGSDDGMRFSAGPQVADGRVVVGGLDGDLLVLDADDGSEIWQRNLSAEILVSPVIADGKVLVRTADGRLLTYELNTGNLLWDTVRELPPLTIRGQSQPAVSDDTIFVAWETGRVAALSLANGSLEWEVSIGQPTGASEVQQIADITGDVSVFGAEIYAAGHNTNLVALAEESGEVLWREEMSAVRGPAVSYGSVIVTDIDSVIRAYDRLSGTSLWTQELIRARYVTAPEIWNDFVVVGDFEGYVHFFDRTTGKIMARLEHDGEPINVPPLAADDLLFVLSADGELAAYRQIGQVGDE
jgi:outer membrane protein assembly factor BamB